MTTALDTARADAAPAWPDLSRLLAPRHIAVVGGREAAVVVRQCRAGGFSGPIWPVNPDRAEIEGLACYDSVAALPEPPDLSFIAVPRDATVGVVRALAARGAGGAVCYAAGFAEVGPDGAELQRELVAAAGDMPLVGPNCFGLLNYLYSAMLWPEQHGGTAVARGVAIVTQSGNMGINLTMQGRSLPIAYMISNGNQAALGFADYIAALAEDERVSAIGLYIEGLTDVAAFSRAAARALERGVPIVAIKSGGSETGARAAMSHTSALAGTEALNDALFRRLGIARVASLHDFLETLKFLDLTGPLGGRRLGLMSSSGGEAALFADLATARGFVFPPLQEAQADSLRAQLPDFTTIANPLDYNTAIWGDPEAMERCFATMLAGGYDFSVLIFDYPHTEAPGIEAWDTALDAFVAAVAATGARAAVMSTMAELLPADVRERLAARGIVPLQGLEEAVAALAAAARIGEARARILVNGSARAAILPPAAPRLLPVAVMSEWDGKRLLAAHGLAVPEGRLVAPDDAATAAAELGYPVAVKGTAPGLAHKSDLGAVQLDLDSAGAVARAAQQVRALLPDPPGGAPRVLVERMVEGAVAEVLVGVVADAQFGLALVLGSGGALVELVRDSRTLLLPTTRDDVAGALDSLAVARLIAGYRGRPEGDREAVIEAVLAIADFAQERRGRLAELDVNPLMVLPRGRGVVVADVMIRMDKGKG
ncbi:MAG: acetate--CoA ligase family protein [Alphaproteobacteria bacterium]